MTAVSNLNSYRFAAPLSGRILAILLLTSPLGLMAQLRATVPVPPAPAAPGTNNVQNSDEAHFTVSSGDTLWGLAKRFFNNPALWQSLQLLNGNIDPKRLPVGQTVTLKVNENSASLLRLRSGTVLATEGKVEVKMPGIEGWLPVQKTWLLPEGTRIKTGNNGFTSVGFNEGSMIVVPPNSDVTLTRVRPDQLAISTPPAPAKGSSAARAAQGQPVMQFHLNEGRMESRVPKGVPQANPEGRYEIRTPRLIVGVRGTNFRVRLEGDDTLATEVVESSVRLTPVDATNTPSKNASVDIAEHFGAISNGASTQAPVPLPAPPVLENAGSVQAHPKVAFFFKPVEKASSYRVQLAHDERFVDLAHELNSPEPVVMVGDVPEGKWFARSTVMVGGIEGLPMVSTFERSRLQVQGQVSPDPLVAGQTRFQWNTWPGARYQFQLADDALFTRILVNRSGLTEGRLAVGDLAPGTYYWRVLAQVPGQGQQAQVSSAALPVQLMGAR